MVYVFAFLTIVSALAFPILLIRVLLKKSRGRLLFIPPIAFFIFSVLGGYSLPDQNSASVKQEEVVTVEKIPEVADEPDATVLAAEEEAAAEAAVAAEKEAAIEAEAVAAEVAVIEKEEARAKEEKAAALKAAALKAQEEEANRALTPSTVEVACEQKAQQLLKLPNTARFPGVMETKPASVLNNEGAWSSWIEGENSFGGTVRTYFDCYYDGNLGIATILPSDN